MNGPSLFSPPVGMAHVTRKGGARNTEKMTSPGRRPPGLSTVPLVVGIAVAAVIVVGVGPPGLLLPQSTVCQLGAELGTYTVWTPALLANIPDGGNVTVAVNEWNVTMTSGSLTVNHLLPMGGTAYRVGEAGHGLTNGLEVNYADFNWTFYETRNVSGYGVNGSPCTQLYIAEVSLPGVCGGILTLPLPDNSTDATEPHVWNGTAGVNGSENYPGCHQTPGSYVWFDSAFHSGAPGNAKPVDWNLCGLSGYHLLELDGIAQVPVTINVPFQGHDISASGFLTWTDARGVNPFVGPTTTYLAPAGWNWTIAPVGPVATQTDPNEPLPSLVAFVRSAC